MCIKSASSQTKGFYDWFVDHYYDEWVRPPDQEETKAELEYAARIGMPGIVFYLSKLLFAKEKAGDTIISNKNIQAS